MTPDELADWQEDIEEQLEQLEESVYDLRFICLFLFLLILLPGC